MTNVARDRHAAMADAQYEVGPGGRKPATGSWRDRSKTAAEDAFGKPAQAVVAERTSFERKAERMRYGEELVVVALAVTEEHPNARPHRHRVRTLPCSPFSWIIIAATFATLPRTSAIAAPTTP